MALLTGGSAATTTLKALLVSGNMNAADVAAFNAYIKRQNAAGNLQINSFGQNTLYLPDNRGFINCVAGDYIMVDPTSGMPIVVSAKAITGGGFVHS